MATFNISSKDLVHKQDGKENLVITKKLKFDSFDENILGLGNIQNKSNQVGVISVIFDLEGFTNFCKQIDPQLAVPEYLSEFLKWLFSQIRLELIEKSFPEGYKLYSKLPFLAKYLGDGVLFLWDTYEMSDTSIRNIVISMYLICSKYKSDFLPRISRQVASPPSQLRCGIARGAVYSVGDGNDYVGPCINMSARLQKLHSLSFCFSRRGIDSGDVDPLKEFIIKKVDIRGIGNDELVYILKPEYEKLKPEDKSKFKSI